MPRNPHGKLCPCRLDTEARTRLFLPQLQKLAQCGGGTRRRQLRKADDCFIKYLADASQALLRTDIKLAPEDYSKLSPFRNLLLFLSRRKPSIKKKREKILQQRGGALPLIGALVGALTSALGGFTGRALYDAL